MSAPPRFPLAPRAVTAVGAVLAGVPVLAVWVAGGALATLALCAWALLAAGLVAAAELRHEQARRRGAEVDRRVRAFMDHAPAVLFVKDTTGRHVLVNRRFRELEAGDEPPALGRADADPSTGRLRADDLAVLADGRTRTFTEEVERPDGRRLLETTKFALLDEHGTPCAVGGIAVDVTERKRAEREHRAAAFELPDRPLYDPLTGLPNRSMLEQRIAGALEAAERRETLVAAVLIDLDAFKTVNDSLGHHAGDALLAELAPRLRDAVRREDVVARVGGDEFLVLCEGLAGEWEALAAAERLASAWEHPFTVAGEEIYITGSAGIAVTRPNRADAATLLREADAAVFRAKERGRGQIEVYDEQLRSRAYDRLRLDGDLRRAIGEAEISVAYQPIVDLRDGRPLAVEALVRWCHPVRGWLAPSDFVPVAEENGLIGVLGRHVLRSACAQLAEWRVTVPGAEGLQVCVNVSARQIARGELPGDVRDALAEAGLPPDALALEITESALMEEMDAPGPVLAGLRALGVGMFLDDFGMGYSSLAHLERIPLDGIKLDRRFVDGIAARPAAAAVVQAVVAMGHSLGLSVTAEGIETREQHDRLRELGCVRGQGYVLARPLPAVEAGPVLTQRLAGVGRRPAALAR